MRARTRQALASERIVVRFGGGHRVVASIADAGRLLIDWPEAERGMTYGVAARIVEAALAGRATEREALSAVRVLCARSAMVVHS